MTDTIVSGIMGLMGALIGGCMTILGGNKVANRTSRDLELAEVRRQKILCITDLSGFRWVIGSNQAPPEFKARFISEVNKIPFLWSGDSEVLKNLRDFYAERTNDRFTILIRSLDNSGLAINNLSDADIRNVFLLI